MIEKTSYLKRATAESSGSSPWPTLGVNVYRPNLSYEVIRVGNDGEKQLTMVRLLKECDGQGLICASTVRAVKTVTDYLKHAGFEVEPYHLRLTARERDESLARFAAGEL